MTSRFLLFVVGRGELPGLRLGDRKVGELDERRLNPILEAWAASQGPAASHSRILDGELRDPRLTGNADFRSGAAAFLVVSGFHDWEKSYRWMSGRGELRLAMDAPWLRLDVVAPLKALRAAIAGLERITLTAVLLDPETGETVTLGSVAVEDDAEASLDLDARGAFSRWGRGRRVHVVLSSDRTWRPENVFPGSPDVRVMSVAVHRVGFDVAPRGSRR